MNVVANYTDWGKRPHHMYGGCGYYRIVLPGKVHGWRVTGKPPVSKFELGTKKEYFDWLIGDAELVYVQRIDHQQAVRSFVDAMQERKIPYIVDLDDDYLNVNPRNPAHQVYRYDAGRPTPQLMAVQYLIYEADAMVPNYLDRDLWSMDFSKTPKPTRILDDEIRVGWMGSWSHEADFDVVRDAIADICDMHPNVRFVSMGYQDYGTMQRLPMHRWHALGGSWIYDDYPEAVVGMDIDIGICPLKDDEFNRSKSNIKALEMGAMGIPVIATKGFDLPYSTIIRDGQNGRLVTTNEEWVAALDELIKDEEKRRHLGEELKKDVFGAWMIQDHLDEHPAAIDSVVKEVAA
jgi:glycosyltransferase involved in cell wall biosynthesis